MLIYLHYPAISWVSIGHLTLYTLQAIKETHHLLFFKCSWNDNLYLWVGKGCSVPYWDQTTESLDFWAGWARGVKIMQRTSPSLLDTNEIILFFQASLNPTQKKVTKEERATEFIWHVLRLKAELCNREGGNKVSKAGNKYLQDCSVGSNYILIALCLSFLICIKGMKISASLVIVNDQRWSSPVSQGTLNQWQLSSSVPVRLWMTSKEQGWMERHGLQPHGSFP